MNNLCQNVNNIKFIKNRAPEYIYCNKQGKQYTLPGGITRCYCDDHIMEHMEYYANEGFPDIAETVLQQV